MWPIDTAGLPLLVPVVASVALVIRAWIGHRTTKVREQAKTERLGRLLADSTPAERASIIRAARRAKSSDS